MSNDWMNERLRREKPEHSAPEGFTERVMSSLEKRREEAAVVESRPPLFWPRVSLSVALMTIAGVFAFELFRPERQAESMVASNPPAPEASNPPFDNAVAVRDIEIPRITPEQFEALAMKLDQPLEKELENVISDTRIAIQFVASNFLPEK